MLQYKLLTNTLGYCVATVLLSSDFVRIHSALRYKFGAWISLWYCLRGIDTDGCGKVVVDFDTLCSLLDRKRSTVYELLRQGKKMGGIRSYTVKKNILTAYYGSLSNLCVEHELRSWGAVSTTTLGTDKDLKRASIESRTALGQSASRSNLTACLKSNQKKAFNSLSVEKAITAQGGFSSLKTVKGARNLILDVDRKYIYGTKALIVFGCNQDSIADGVGVSTKTVQRFQTNLEKRQVATTRPEYQRVLIGIQGEYIERGDYMDYTDDLRVYRDKRGNYYMREKSYLKLKNSDWVNEEWATADRISRISEEHFFVRWGRYFCAKNNIYHQDSLPKLESMRYQKRAYKSRFKAAEKERFTKRNQIRNSTAVGKG